MRRRDARGLAPEGFAHIFVFNSGADRYLQPADSLPVLAQAIMSMSSLAQRIEVGPFRLAIPRALFSFLTVGVLGLTTDLGILWIGERLGLPLWAARAVSLPLATFVTWTLNRRHTFGASGLKPHEEIFRYCAVAAVAQSVNYVVGLGAADILPHIPHLLAAFIGSVVATLFSYSGQRYFTFARAERV